MCLQMAVLMDVALMVLVVCLALAGHVRVKTAGRVQLVISPWKPTATAVQTKTEVNIARC